MALNNILENATPQFNVIMEILKLKNDNAERGRKMLCVIDHVIDYYTNRQDDDLKIPVVYMPYSEDWAQQLCEEFVTIKLFAITSPSALSSLAIHVNRNKDMHFMYNSGNRVSPTQRRIEKEKSDFYKKLYPLINQLSATQTSEMGSSILFSKGVLDTFLHWQTANRRNSKNHQNLRYWHLGLFLKSMKKWDMGAYPVYLHDIASKQFLKTLRDNRNNSNVSLSNIALFPTDNSGSFDKDCIASFQWARLNNYKQFYPSLRNVFIFSFSPKPYRLQRLFDFKKKLKDRMQIHNDEVLDFISFTSEEVDNIFDRHCNTEIITSVNDNSYTFKLEDVLPNKYILRRNEAALCVNNDMTKVYTQLLHSENECPEYILDVVTAPLQNQIVGETFWRMKHFVYLKDVFVVLGYELNEQLTSMFKDWLLNTLGANSVTFGSYKDLKPGAAPYRNKIAEDRILIMSLRDHYTNTPFHRYPNSFDPYCVNPNQLVFQLVNEYAFGDNYQYGLYAYNKQLRKILYSPFRKEMLPIAVKDMAEPTKPRDDDYDMEVDRSNNRVAPLYVTYQDATRQYLRSEWMYYEYNGDNGISPLSDLMDIYADEEGLKLQPLSQFIDVIKEHFLDNERDLKEEKRFREAPEFGLSQEEKTGDVELWKLLLKKKQDEKTPEAVYGEIGLENEISYGAYLRWTESDYGLQRSKALQKKVIVDYLKLDLIYLRYIRNIKRLSTNNAEEVNGIIRNFLLQALLNDNLSEVLSSLEDDAKDLLYISNENDIKTIIDEVNKVKEVKQVKQITEIQ